MKLKLSAHVNIASARSNMINDSSVDNVHVPEPSQVSATRRAMKLKEKWENPAASILLEVIDDFLPKYLFEEQNSSKKGFVAEEFVSLYDQLTIPFSSKYLFEKGQAFIAKRRSVRLIMDFTPNVFSQGFKLGCFALLDLHFVNGERKSPVIPLMFALPASRAQPHTWLCWLLT